jgi:hypothetical protein
MPEDVIREKLDYYRQGRSEKHLTDVRRILANTQIVSEYLLAWIEKLGLRGIWTRYFADDR